MLPTSDAAAVSSAASSSLVGGSDAMTPLTLLLRSVLDDESVRTEETSKDSPSESFGWVEANGGTSPERTCL